MAKFNRMRMRTAVGAGPIAAEATPSTLTHEGGPGYLRGSKSELFLLAVANMVGEDTFYESAGARDSRFAQLVARVAVEDVEWFGGFLPWLRTEANMRSASLVAAAEAVRARLAAGLSGDNRTLVSGVLARADEPGEFLAYWMSRFGRAVPKPVKRGVADGVRRLYSQRSLLKYDTVSHAFRFADVIDLVHPEPADDKAWQGALFRYALDRRHGRSEPVPGDLAMVGANARLRALAADEPHALLDAARLAEAGMTWEDALSLIGSTVDKADLWAAMIPSMGLMALARNLRNFDEAGVADSVAEQVIARFTDPEQVARSRMFPFRWLSAYEAAPSLRWGHALDRALQASLANLPALGGRTLILVDTSSSMTGRPVSKRSTVSPLKAAAVFGVALAAKGERVDLYGFANGVFRHDVAAGASVIREVDRLVRRSGEVGHGTDITGSVRRTYAGHDRVVIVSDMQTIGGHYGRGVTDAVPAYVPLYGFNLGGYRPAAFDAGAPNRIEFGGLTDATFRMLPLIEAGRDATWPWLST
jgi:hypothetical protein